MGNEQKKIEKLEKEIEDLKAQIQAERDSYQWWAKEAHRLLTTPPHIIAYNRYFRLLPPTSARRK